MKYYINKNAQSTGELEVHKEVCEHFPNKSNREILGEFLNCKEAIIYAKKSSENGK